MKTKPFLLATAGSTVDGRTIDDKMIEEMASSYDPKTYGARLNIEHIRGISGQAPFRAYGDVLELSVGEVDVKFNDKTEKRKALYGVFDVTDEAKQLNDANQKVYPSIEIEPNFGGKGFAYLMGCALTDSPAAIATEKMKFNRQVPGMIHLSREEAAPLEFAEAADGAAGDTFLNKLSAMLDGVAAKFTPTPPKEGNGTGSETPSNQGGSGSAAAAFDFSQMKPMFEEMGKAFATSIDGLRTELREELDSFGVKLKKVEDTIEDTPAPTYAARPAANGSNGKYAVTDC